DLLRLLLAFSPSLFSLFFNSSGAPLDLHSFPTRRSSDLYLHSCSNASPPTSPPPNPSPQTQQTTPPNSSPPASPTPPRPSSPARSEEHTSELQSRENLVCRLLLEKKKKKKTKTKQRHTQK